MNVGISNVPTAYTKASCKVSSVPYFLARLSRNQFIIRVEMSLLKPEFFCFCVYRGVLQNIIKILIFLFRLKLRNP